MVCIGNSLVADDSVGWAVFQELEKRGMPPGTRLEFLAVSGMRVVDELSGEDLLIVVDAQCTGARVGSLCVREILEVDAAIGPPVTSHDIGIREALDVCRLIYPERSPKKTLLLGIEGRDFEQVGGPMTPVWPTCCRKWPDP